MLQKLQIYYQPKQINNEPHASLTVSYSDFDEMNGTYKKKIVLEQNGEKFKIKNYPTNFAEVKAFLEALDLSNFKSSDVDYGESYYYIKHGEHVLATSNPEDIREILDWVGFDKIRAYELSQYKRCD